MMIDDQHVALARIEEEILVLSHVQVIVQQTVCGLRYWKQVYSQRKLIKKPQEESIISNAVKGMVEVVEKNYIHFVNQQL